MKPNGPRQSRSSISRNAFGLTLREVRIVTDISDANYATAWAAYERANRRANAAYAELMELRAEQARRQVLLDVVCRFCGAAVHEPCTAVRDAAYATREFHDCRYFDAGVPFSHKRQNRRSEAA